jgi:hypothetical protein
MESIVNLPIFNEKGVTVKQLKEVVRDLPETNPHTGDDYTVWVGYDNGYSNPVLYVCKLNAGDLILETR